MMLVGSDSALVLDRGDWEQSITSVQGPPPPPKKPEHLKHPGFICIHESSLALGSLSPPPSLSIVCFSDPILGNGKYRPICCPSHILQKAKLRFDFKPDAKVSPGVDASEAVGKQAGLIRLHTLFSPLETDRKNEPPLLFVSLFPQCEVIRSDLFHLFLFPPSCQCLLVWTPPTWPPV